MNWPVTSLGEVADIVAGVTLGRKTRETVFTEVPYLRVANVQDGYFDLSEIKNILATKSEIERCALQDGDLLLTEGGDIDKLGRGTRWSNQIPLCIHQNHIFRVRLPKDSYDPDYVSFQIGSSYGKSYFLAHAKKTTGIASINQKVLNVFPLVSPPLDVQRGVAARLKAQVSEAHHASKAAQAQICEVSALDAAAYRDAFCSITPIAVPPTFSAAPTGWAWKKLSNVAALESGHTPSRLQPEWWGGDISWLSLTEIRALDGTWVNQTRIRTNPAGIANSSARILPRGTVCLSRTASVGFVAIMAEPMATSQDFANWVCGDDLDPEFLMFALIASRKAIRDMATGATHKTIYMPALGSFHICAPDIDEQRRIAGRLKGQLAEVTALQAALTQRVKDIAALPKRILAQAFEI